MSFATIPISDSYHYYHHGVYSDPPWAYNDARLTIVSQWANFLKDCPNTSNVKFQDVSFKDLGGSIARFGTFDKDSISVANAGSHTEFSSLTGVHKWECWFDISYTGKLTFANVNLEILGMSVDEANTAIATADVD
ncbi:hypothetical protein V499_00639 [Pseudogymnoascus sp. VKM F-103]|nr:hypothetical protein V499_00639 [Pseudogymnoascus sp. VKM F-103]